MRESQARTLALQIKADGLGQVVETVRVNHEAAEGFGWGVSIDGAQITSPGQLASVRNGTLGDPEWRSMVRLSQDDADTLRRLAASHNTSINTEIERAVRAYLDEQP